MIMPHVKRIYSHPFRHEDRSIASILLYRITLAAAWAAYSWRYRAVLARTSSFIREYAQQVKKEQKPAFVFANGPSLSSLDLSKVKQYCENDGYDLIAINSFLSKSAHQVKPTFAVFADNVHFSGGDTQYSKDIEVCRDLGITHFTPAKYVTDADSPQMGFCSLCNVDATGINNVTKPAGYYGVTAFFAMSLAIMIGYEKIYICGFDNSYFQDFNVDAHGKMRVVHRHYYDGATDDNDVLHQYGRTSDFFFDVYRHFHYIEKIADGHKHIRNVAPETYISSIARDLSLDLY